VTAGCGHQSGDAFRVRGDLRAEPAPTRLILRQVEPTTDAGPVPNATSASATASGGPYATGGSPPVPPVGGLYATVSLLPRMLATWLAMAGLASGLVLLLLPSVPCGPPGSGRRAAGGTLAAWWIQESGGANSFLAFLLLVPLACLALPSFGMAAFAARRRPVDMAVLLAISLLALGFLVQLFSFLEAFPSAPTA